jgi:hypothetical protein
LHGRGRDRYAAVIQPSTRLNQVSSFDFNGSQLSPGKDDQKAEWRGIYEFEGSYLKICYRWRKLPDGPSIERPDSFVGIHGRDGTSSVKLRRLAD